MTPLSTLELVGAAGIVVSSALNTLLGFGAGRSRAAPLLGAFFLCMTFSSIASVLIIGWDEWMSPAALRWTRVVGISVSYLLGPLFYAYTQALLWPGRAWRTPQWLLHLAPFLGVFVLCLVDALVPGLQRPLRGGSLMAIAYHAWMIQSGLYFVVALWRAYAARPDLEQLPAVEIALRLTWVRYVLIVISGLWLLSGARRVAIFALGMDGSVINLVNALGSSVALFCLTWFGVRRGILLPFEPQRTTIADAAQGTESGTGTARYARSALDDAGRERVAADLVRLMREQRLYVDPDLDLPGLSRHSGWSSAYISQALNLHLQCNFFEFVNGFRIDDARARLADPSERRTILDVAVACGFGSKSTFNTVFKRMTGATPSEFRRRAGTNEPVGSDA